MSGIDTPDHTVPYGTVLSEDAFPGTSCLATIMLSLRDEVQTFLARWAKDATPPTLKLLANVQTPEVRRDALPTAEVERSSCDVRFLP
jgi:hypothetical protein